MPLYSKKNLQEILTSISNNTIEKLDISAASFRFSDEHILSSTELSEISEALKHNTSIQQLDACYNKITAKGASYIAEMIENNRRIKILNLRYNRIDASGAELISNALEKNTSLIQLNIEYNHIGDAGIVALAQALSVNQTLTCIDLTANSITDTGALAILKMLETNYSLTKIDISFVIIPKGLPYYQPNKVSPQHQESIQKCVKRNSDLQALLTQEVAKAASSLLKCARNLLRPNESNKIGLPEEIKKYILTFIDDKQVLTPDQFAKIIQFAQDKGTLAKIPSLFFKKHYTKSEFLKETHCDHYHSSVTSLDASLFKAKR